MGDKDEAESPHGTRDRESIWQWKWVPIIVPQMEALFILLPPLNKSLVIFDNVFAFMPIHIHALLGLAILPLKSGEPVTSCALTNSWLSNSGP